MEHVGVGRGGAVDLSRGPALSAEQAAGAQREYEVRQGMRCAGCGRRIGVGFRFVKLEVVSTPQGIGVGQLLLGACNGSEGCDFAELARQQASMMELVEFVWLDGGDAPVAGGFEDA